MSQPWRGAPGLEDPCLWLENDFEGLSGKGAEGKQGGECNLALLRGFRLRTVCGPSSVWAAGVRDIGLLQGICSVY